MVMHVCGGVPGVQLGGRCCLLAWTVCLSCACDCFSGCLGWGLLFWGGVLHIIVKELGLLYVRFYVHVMLSYV